MGIGAGGGLRRGVRVVESGHGAIDEAENYWGEGYGDQETREEKVTRVAMVLFE